jgi:AraC-like DNA-binding protein
MGTSYSDMVAEVRLDTACHLLLQSNERISEIAQRLGYTGTSSFSRAFTHLTKMPPVIYRRQRTVLGSDISRLRKELDAEKQGKPSRLARDGKTPSLPNENAVAIPGKGKNSGSRP